MTTATTTFLTDQLLIKQWLSENCRFDGPYTIAKNGEVEVDGSMVLTRHGRTTLKRFMVQFSRVSGDFNCEDCLTLESLEGSPRTLGGELNCANCCRLKTLQGAPDIVHGNVTLVGCNLTNLEGCPQYIGGWLDCQECMDLKSLAGIGRVVGTVTFERLQEAPTAEAIRSILLNKLHMVECIFVEMYRDTKRPTPEYDNEWLYIINDYATSGDTLTAIAQFEDYYKVPFTGIMDTTPTPMVVPEL